MPLSQAVITVGGSFLSDCFLHPWHHRSRTWTDAGYLRDSYRRSIPNRSCQRSRRTERPSITTARVGTCILRNTNKFARGSMHSQTVVHRTGDSLRRWRSFPAIYRQRRNESWCDRRHEGPSRWGDSAAPQTCDTIQHLGSWGSGQWDSDIDERVHPHERSKSSQPWKAAARGVEGSKALGAQAPVSLSVSSPCSTPRCRHVFRQLGGSVVGRTRARTQQWRWRLLWWW